MAKILDNSATRNVQLRQEHDWLKTEINELPSIYEAKKQKDYKITSKLCITYNKLLK